MTFKLCFNWPLILALIFNFYFMYSDISVQKLKKNLDDGLGSHALLVDVRTRLEFNAGHIDGALNIPVNKVLEHVDELSKYSDLYFQCQSGGRSALACELLNDLPAQLFNVQDGLLAWVGEGYPLVR